MTIRNLVWSTELATNPPANVKLYPIPAKQDSHQRLEFVLPPYLYFEDGGRRLYVDGTITFDTLFGAVELPIDDHITITSDDLSDLTETREFFRDRLDTSDAQSEQVTKTP